MERKRGVSRLVMSFLYCSSRRPRRRGRRLEHRGENQKAPRENKLRGAESGTRLSLSRKKSRKQSAFSGNLRRTAQAVSRIRLA